MLCRMKIKWVKIKAAHDWTFTYYKWLERWSASSPINAELSNQKWAFISNITMSHFLDNEVGPNPFFPVYTLRQKHQYNPKDEFTQQFFMVPQGTRVTAKNIYLTPLIIKNQIYCCGRNRLDE